MSKKSTGPQQRVSSGQFSTLESREGANGSIEYVFDEATQSLEESSSVEALDQPPKVTEDPTSGPGRFAMVGLLCGFLIICGGIAVVIGMDHAEPEADEVMEEEEASFQPYNGAANKSPEPKKVERRAAATDGELPEELEGWDLEDSNEEVIVLEETHPEEEEEDTLDTEQAALRKEYVPRSPDNYTLDLDEIRKSRRANATQRNMLRQMNDDLDRGKLKPFRPGPPPVGAKFRPPMERFPTNYSGPDPAEIRAKAIENRRQFEEAEAERVAAEEEGVGEVGEAVEPTGAESATDVVNYDSTQ